MKPGEYNKVLRDRLAAHGPEGLSDAELLSLLLDNVSGHSSIETAENMLAAYNGSLAALARVPLSKLRMHEGIGIGRASTLTAAFELGKRIQREASPEPDIIRSADDVVRLLGSQLSTLRHEELWVVYMSSAGSILEQRRVSQGGVTALIVDYRLVVKRALELLASAFILVHNHPSGIPLPSEEDKRITTRTAEAAALFDIVLTDHIIVSSGGHYSFRTANLIG